VGASARRLIAVRVDPDVLERYRKEARRRKIGYQTLINEVLAQHVGKELRRRWKAVEQGCAPTTCVLLNSRRPGREVIWLPGQIMKCITDVPSPLPMLTDATAREGAMPDSPKPGDIIIHRQIHSPAVYTLSVLNGSHQVTYQTYEEAFDRAQRFALRECLDVWYTTDEDAFEPIAHHRPTRS